MTDLINVIAMLKAKTSASIYTGEIPESQAGTSILVTNLANLHQGRSVDGRKYGKSSVWRLTVVAELQSDVESVLAELDSLDNVRNQWFQRVFTVLAQSELGLNNEPYRRAFVDMSVYR